jgi:hypothetical protein
MGVDLDAAILGALPVILSHINYFCRGYGVLGFRLRLERPSSILTYAVDAGSSMVSGLTVRLNSRLEAASEAGRCSLSGVLITKGLI